MEKAIIQAVESRLRSREPLAGKYHVGGLIGSGGCGCVFAVDDGGEKAAVKVLPMWADHDGSETSVADAKASLAEQSEAVSGFLSSAKGPGLVPVPARFASYAMGKQALVCDLILITPFFPASLALEQEPMKWVKVSSILAGCLKALEPRHEAGQVHGNLRPENVFLADDGVKVGDMGLARTMFDVCKLKEFPADFRYCAPEAFIDPLMMGGDPRADVYSLGLLAFRLIEGALPFERESQGDQAVYVKRRLAGEPVIFEKEMPLEAEMVLGQAMALDPNKRFSGAGEFIKALGPVASYKGKMPRSPAPVEVRGAAPQEPREPSPEEMPPKDVMPEARREEAGTVGVFDGAVPKTPAPMPSDSNLEMEKPSPPRKPGDLDDKSQGFLDMGMGYIEKQQWQEAMECFEEVLDKVPENTEAQELLAQVKPKGLLAMAQAAEMRGDLEAALEALDMVLPLLEDPEPHQKWRDSLAEATRGRAATHAKRQELGSQALGDDSVASTEIKIAASHAEKKKFDLSWLFSRNAFIVAVLLVAIVIFMSLPEARPYYLPPVPAVNTMLLHDAKDYGLPFGKHVATLSFDEEDGYEVLVDFEHLDGGEVKVKRDTVYFRYEATKWHIEYYGDWDRLKNWPQ